MRVYNTVLDAAFSEQKPTFKTAVQEKDTTFPTIFGEGNRSTGSGENGATFTPSVSNEGIISWTNDKGLPNPAPVNIKGYTPQKGVDYFDGKDGKDGEKGDKGDKGDTGPEGPQGEQGIQGIQGEKGADGHTPVKGTDYFTKGDITEMVQAVITALPKYNGEVIEL